MTIPFKFTIEHIIIVVLAAMLFLKSCGKENDCTPVATVTTVEEKTVTTVDSSGNSGIKNKQPEKLQVIETSDKIRKVENPKDLSEEEKKEVKTVSRYLETTNLPGAVIVSEIISEGRILEHNVKATVDHTEKTTTTTETIVKQPGGLFLSPGFDYSPLGGIEAAETTLTYIKGNLGASVGPYYNFRRIPGLQNPGSFGLKLKIHIKL